MNATWITQAGHAHAVVFLNGWGMDGGLFRLAPAPAARDLLMFNDYRDLDLPAGALAALARYETVCVVAWSMGVWAAGALAGQLPRVCGALAINGTGQPVHAAHGIPPKAYRLTEAQFGEAVHARFLERMCGGAHGARAFLHRARPARPAADVGAELSAIRQQAEAGRPAGPFPFTRTLIGGADVIVPPENQTRYWTGRAAIVPLEMPHLPFLNLTWEEIIRHAEAS